MTMLAARVPAPVFSLVLGPVRGHDVHTIAAAALAYAEACIARFVGTVERLTDRATTSATEWALRARDSQREAAVALRSVAFRVACTDLETALDGTGALWGRVEGLRTSYLAAVAILATVTR